jgi:type IV pilus assembly protein PilP
VRPSLALRIGIWPLMLALAACNQGPDGDLVSYVEQVKSRQTAAPEAPKAPKKRETFRYRADSEGIRDPFLGQAPTVVSRPGGSTGAKGPRPDNRRGRQALEQYPLDSLALVGTLSSAGRTVALVRSGDGVIHQVRVGDYMGQNYGKVVTIGAKEVRLRELVPDGNGGWRQRPATLSLAK